MPRQRKRNRHLPPCVYESHGAYYHVVKGVWHPLGSNLPAALQEYARRVQTGAASEHQLDALIDSAFDAMKRRKDRPLKPETVRKYTTAAGKLKHLLRAFSRPDQVKQRDAALVKKLLAPTPNMANKVLTFARLVWADFLESQLVEENPFAAIKLNREAKRTRLYTWEEWDKIRLHADARLRCVMDGLYLTDRRVGDVLKIDERDLWTEGVYFKEQKTGKEIIIAWNDDLRAWVNACRNLYGKVVPVAFGQRDRPLLRNRRGRSPDYSTIGRQWRRALKAAGVEDGHIHDGRAFSATEAKRQGLDAQALLNHTDASTTRIYLRGREIEVVHGPRIKRSA